jgi:hypothetical protein
MPEARNKVEMVYKNNEIIEEVMDLVVLLLCRSLLDSPIIIILFFYWGLWSMTRRLRFAGWILNES